MKSLCRFLSGAALLLMAGMSAATPMDREFLNNAQLWELEGLPCVGPMRARMIMEARSKNGPFYKKYKRYMNGQYMGWYQYRLNELSTKPPPPYDRRPETLREYRLMLGFANIYAFNRKTLECIAGQTPRMTKMGIVSPLSFILTEPAGGQ